MSKDGIENKRNWQLYSFANSFRKKLLNQLQSKSAQQWAINFKYYTSQIYACVKSIADLDDLYTVLEDAPGWGKFINKHVFERWYDDDSQDGDQAIYDAFYQLCVGFDTKTKTTTTTQPSALEVAVCTESFKKKTVKRVRRGGPYKNSINAKKLECIGYTGLVVRKAGQYLYIAVGLLDAFERGGEYVSKLTKEGFLTNINIIKACYEVFDGWDASKTYSAGPKWKVFFVEAKKGSGQRVFDKDKYAAAYANIKGLVGNQHAQRLDTICEDGFAYDNDKQPSNDNDNGYQPTRATVSTDVTHHHPYTNST